MHRLANLHIGTKIYSVVGLLSVVSICIAGLALMAMQTFNRHVGDVESASQRAFVGEQINSMIYAVVMDSRGVYMARDRAEAEKFGVPLIKNLHEIERLMKAWQDLLPAERKHETDKASDNVKKFVEFRSETVRRVSRSTGPPLANTATMTSIGPIARA